MCIFYLKLSAYNAPGWNDYMIIHHIPGRWYLPYLSDTYLGKNFKLHPNLGIPANITKRFPVYYKQMFSLPNLPLANASHVIWYNKCITEKPYII